MRFVQDQALQLRVAQLIKLLELNHISPSQVIVFRSFGSSSRARARIWSFPKIWQLALRAKPHYCIEVLDEKFSRLGLQDQTRVLIHELMHIPKTFSGALRPHRHRGGTITHHSVEKLFRKLPHDYHSR